MSEAIWQGILVGLALSFSAGPVMFALIQTSLKEGFARAMLMEIGIVTADTLCIIGAYYSIGQWIGNPKWNNYILIVGGVLLIFIGLRSFKKKSARIRAAREFMKGSKTHPVWLIVQGFLYNLLNPSVILFWIGVMTLASANYEGNKKILTEHFATILTTMLSFDTLKAFFSYKLRRFITPRFMLYTSFILGIVFSVFGIALIAKGIIGLV